MLLRNDVKYIITNLAVTIDKLYDLIAFTNPISILLIDDIVIYVCF